ncbi:unnamed protein product [Caenorhabditis auriculariae]|uniref:Guanylate cyclase n=1 Tax=Caenorhabditis auriculariae TaxID=2777116 RepID=A0A8S1HE43_9PELO|nr:unnamed protein product [Caenorhabditis auriculariae]
MDGGVAASNSWSGFRLTSVGMRVGNGVDNSELAFREKSEAAARQIQKRCRRIMSCEKGSELFAKESVCCPAPPSHSAVLADILVKCPSSSLHYICFFLVLLAAVVFSSQKILQVGLIAASDNNPDLSSMIGWSRTAAAVGVAWDYIVSKKILPAYDTMNLTWQISDCDESTAADIVLQYALANAHVVLGPPCGRAALVAGTVAKHLDFPIILWGPPSTSSLLDQFEYPTVVSTSSSTLSQAQSLIRLLELYNWQDIAIISYITRSSLIPRCSSVFADFENLISSNPNITIVYRRQITSISNTTLTSTLDAIQQVARIVVVCMEDKLARRNLMISVAEQGLDTNEYVWLLVEGRRAGFDPTYYEGAEGEDDGKDELALRAARRFMIMDYDQYNNSAWFADKVASRFNTSPFNCPLCTNISPNDSMVGQLADAMLLYAYSLNKSITAGIEQPSGTTISDLSRGTFNGYSGAVIINENATRNPIFIVYILDSTNLPIPIISITENLDNYSDPVKLLVEESVIWASRGGFRPLSVPVCGFSGDDCPKSFIEQYLPITLASSGGALVLIIGIVISTFILIRTKRQEEERLNMLWQVPFELLTKPLLKGPIQSSRSFSSSVTTSTKLTINSKKETERHAFYFFGMESVVARKHPSRVAFSKNDYSMLRRMRDIDHDNLCKFIGLVLDGPMLMSVWRYCLRGSLKDVISKGGLQMDWFFKYSLIRDVCEAVHYLHHSSLGAHGWLSSSTCLVDERWQVKISFFGLISIKRFESREPQGKTERVEVLAEKEVFADLLHFAPEHMRDPTLLPSKEGDIYSFAIICSEIITRKSAWNLENEAYDVDELLYRIKKGGRNPIRPSLDTEDEHNSSMSLLVRDCWSEEPDIRPNCDQIRSLIKSLNHNRSANLMDHVFNVLEQYASNLEDEVHARMKELTEEKKRSDVLLYRMLPRQVAEKLKMGVSVEPETFDCVTIFFSDVVSFTTLASRCTPLQVVTLLNDLYTTFDATIDKHDVYKVETIGDGYLCVSGLPHRNGNEHAKEVAEMSFALLKAIQTFRIPHLPKERISIRIGLHTGPVVTGVVGMTMPRYCLFGDSVNTASRMESNGKRNGKGTVATYWLLADNEIEELADV